MIRLGDEKRQNVIITAARRIARESDFAAVTHGAVAKRCVVQTSVATVRHYFGTKDDLWRAVIDAEPDLIERAREAGWVE